MSIKKFMIAALSAASIMGANAQNNNIAYEIDLDATEVTASRAPIPGDKAVRIVQVINHEQIQATAAQSVNDLLKNVAGVDVRQRGAYGVQTDIGINGGNSDQLTVLLNGINITNPQTGHLTADLPVNPDDIERIEVIEGGASRVYGSSAFAGAINIVTRNERESCIKANVNGGSFGTFGGNASVNLLSGAFTNRLSGGYTQSDGGTENSDFKKGNAFWRGQYASQLFDVKLQAGMSTMDYGANTFYGTGSHSQYEEGRRYLVSAQGEYKGKVNIQPQAYWNRSLDHYVWTRSNPSAYENFHQVNVYGANVNAYTTWALGKTAFGVEYRRENILSTRLGKALSPENYHKVPGHNAYYKYKDGRSNLGFYLEHDVILNNVSLSLGVLANHNSAVKGDLHLYPGIDLSWRPIDGVKLYASFNQSLRTPTYTDLYYNGPGLEGNSQLKPEKSTDYAVGASYTSKGIRAQVKGFYRRGTDMIDWVKKPDASVWTTANSDVDNLGYEALVQNDMAQLTGLRNPFIRSLTLSYCHIRQYRVHQEKQSAYASQLHYLRDKFVVSMNHRIVNTLSAQWDFNLRNRSGEFDNARTGKRENFGTASQLDLRLLWDASKQVQFYAQANNLTSHKYYDISNVRQPGAWFMAGTKLNFGL